jgi:2-desacetyl-2-hydroxyethyl bacteriochlorophyllide A dehydrogenase
MRQIRAYGPQDLRMATVEEPSPGAGEVLVDVKACGICGSDKWFWHVEEPTDYVAGHEVAGLVIAVGPGVETLAVGDKVAVNNVKGCGECPACMEGAYVRCTNKVEHMGFGFSERVVVPERNCLKLHEKIGYEEGSLIFDNWGTPYSSLNRTSMGKGDRVVVIGCGPIGLAAIGLALARGAIVAAVDPLPSRLEAAKRMGAVLATEPDAGAADELLRFARESGRDGADYIVECSGKATSYELGLQVIRVGGTIVAIGEGAKFAFNSSTIIHKHLTIVGTLYSTIADGAAVQELMLAGSIDPLAFVTHRFPMADIPSRFGDVIAANDGLIKAIVVN